MNAQFTKHSALGKQRLGRLGQSGCSQDGQDGSEWAAEKLELDRAPRLDNQFQLVRSKPAALVHLGASLSCLVRAPARLPTCLPACLPANCTCVGFHFRLTEMILGRITRNNINQARQTITQFEAQAASFRPKGEKLRGAAPLEAAAASLAAWPARLRFSPPAPVIQMPNRRSHDFGEGRFLL